MRSVMNRWMTALRAAALLATLPAAQADVVTDWHDIAMASFAQSGTPLLAATRTLALTHAAMFDAINAVERRYMPYGSRAEAAPGTSAEAAASAAAHKVLATLLPARAKELEQAHRSALASTPEGAARERGVQLGERVAADLLAARAGDVPATAPYRPQAAPGVYVPTALPIGIEFAQARPWLMQRPDQFRPAAPPVLATAEWAHDFDEVKDLGGRTSDKRSAEQTDVARFWVVVWPQSWSPIVRQLAAGPGRTPIQNARTFTLTSLAAADAFIAVFDAKYVHNAWRPITAIRNGDLDGNEATAPAATWLPLIDTPLHPEYPCAHCIVASAVATVLQGEFGRGRLGPLSMTSPTAPGVTRRWERLADIVTEISNARVWGGIHYRHSTRVGEEMGRAIGELALTRHLQPAH
ncbi:MAG TPA: vanadium-dependent haloperoxidase [Burkholderiaceae bacterium]|nr:vanadium-dependent haloperoxidase [Burkholderiaceae bacterium]